MAKVVAPIKFDQVRLRKRRSKARIARERREAKRRLPGGELHYASFWWRIGQEPLWLDRANDNVEGRR